MSQTRRDFLKTVAAGAAVAPWIGSSRLFAAEAAKVRHASIGAGGMAFADITSFSKHPGFELVAVADVDLARTDRVKERFPQARIYQDWRELLRIEVGRVKFVKVSTCAWQHEWVAVDALL